MWKNISAKVPVLLMTGRIQNDNYTNNNGEKVYSVQIIAEEIEFAERKKHSGCKRSPRVETLVAVLHSQTQQQMMTS